MPGFLQTLSQFTPHAWAMKGFQDQGFLIKN
jgi:hypothetical protein